jgi:hypothetical protein
VHFALVPGSPQRLPQRLPQPLAGIGHATDSPQLSPVAPDRENAAGGEWYSEERPARSSSAAGGGGTPRPGEQQHPQQQRTPRGAGVDLTESFANIRRELDAARERVYDLEREVADLEEVNESQDNALRQLQDVNAQLRHEIQEREEAFQRAQSSGAATGGAGAEQHPRRQRRGVRAEPQRRGRHGSRARVGTHAHRAA